MKRDADGVLSNTDKMPLAHESIQVETWQDTRGFVSRVERIDERSSRSKKNSELLLLFKITMM